LGGLHPRYADAVCTYSAMSGDAVAVLPPDVFAAGVLGGVVDDKTSCVVVQSPDLFGNLRDLSGAAATCHAKGAAAGSDGRRYCRWRRTVHRQSLEFRPHVGLLAAKAKYLRQMPRRLCGETADALGRRGFVLTLSTREQHIRRDKATSNICTNLGLASLAFTIQLTLLGDPGLHVLARINHANAVALADRLGRCEASRF
jgi:glycine dehydrogenase subunit 1